MSSDKEWKVHTGHPSWHQRQAGHFSASIYSCNSEEEAKKYLSSFKENIPMSQHTLNLPQDYKMIRRTI